MKPSDADFLQVLYFNEYVNKYQELAPLEDIMLTGKMLYDIASETIKKDLLLGRIVKIGGAQVFVIESKYLSY